MRILDFADGFSSATAPTIANLKTIGSEQTISNGGEISFTASPWQVIKVKSDGGEVNPSTTPFGTSSTPEDGAVLEIMGTDSTNHLTLQNNDSAKGLILNGPASLTKYRKIFLTYDATEDRYIEDGRNF